MRKVMMAVLAGVLLISALAACGSKGKSGGVTIKEGTLMVGAEVGYPPMEYYDEDGATPIGFDVEVSKALAEEMGLKFELVDTAWDEIFAGVDSDKYDCIISGVSYTKDRDANYLLSEPYVANMPVLLVSKDSGITDISGLTGKTVAVQMETTADFIMQEQIEGGLDTEVKQFEKVINAFDEIKAGHVDAVCTDSVVAVYYLGDEAVNYNIVWESDTKEPIVICMKKGNEALAEELNKAMASLFESGKIKEIAERYFGSDITEGLEAGFTGK